MNRRQFLELGAATSASAVFAAFTIGGTDRTPASGQSPSAQSSGMPPSPCASPTEYDHVPMGGEMPAPSATPTPTPSPTPRENDHRPLAGSLAPPPDPKRRAR